MELQCEKLLTEKQIIFKEVKNLLDIGIALTTEKNLDRLLEMIVTEARNITNADAGTLYLKEEDGLYFKVIQNQSLNIFQGSNAQGGINLPPVPLDPKNVSGFVALTGKSVNIEDVYQEKEFDFTGPRNYDKLTGYRTRSMLVIPIQNQKKRSPGCSPIDQCLEK